MKPNNWKHSWVEPSMGVVIAYICITVFVVILGYRALGIPWSIEIITCALIGWYARKNINYLRIGREIALIKLNNWAKGDRNG